LFPDDKAVAKLPPPPMMGQPVKTEADINALTTEAQAQLEDPAVFGDKCEDPTKMKQRT
jgi:hypothetical protein